VFSGASNDTSCRVYRTISEHNEAEKARDALSLRGSMLAESELVSQLVVYEIPESHER